MNKPLSIELYWLVMTVLMTSVLFWPYIINRMKEHGIWQAVWNPQPDTRPKAQWAERLMRAHSNAVENLVIFAPLVLVLQITGISTPTTASACMVYFFVRLAHVLLYTFAVPLLRTVVFVIGWGCQMALALTLLNVI
ncbi:MAG: MAPEG family protein [Methylococcaceae bacterium]|nr:MAPEG family protein [Methylococcaceae bacterium]